MACLNKKTVHVWSKVIGLLPSLQEALPDVILKQIRSSENYNAESNLSRDEVELLKEAEILVTDSQILGDIMYDIPNTKWVQSTWAGVDSTFKKLDKNKPYPNFIFTKLCNDGFAEYMAEYIIAHIIINERRFLQMWDYQKSKKWLKKFIYWLGHVAPIIILCQPAVEKGRTLRNLIVGLMGVGSVGMTVAKFLKQREATVYGFAKHQRSTDEFGYFDRIETDISALLFECDYLCNILPSTSETKGLLNNVLQKCTKKPVFINLGRGDIIDEENLIYALKKEWISKAILDVFQNEPLPSNSPLWNLPNVVITPHVGSLTQDHQVVQCFIQNYKRFLSGQELLHVVDWKDGY